MLSLGYSCYHRRICEAGYTPYTAYDLYLHTRKQSRVDPPENNGPVRKAKYSGAPPTAGEGGPSTRVA